MRQALYETDTLTAVNDKVHGRSSTVGLVGYLFGISGREAIPGPALVELLGVLGVGEAAARRLLTRMRAAGQLTGVRDGRRTRYALAGAFGAAVRARRDDRGVVPAWEGHFHAVLHHVPEARRAYRDRLRRAATLVGYAAPQPGLLIAVGDRSAGLAEILAQAPIEARVQVATLGLDVDDARALARSAWALDQLAADLTGHLATLRGHLAGVGTPGEGADAVRELAAMTSGVVLDLLRDPGLPVEIRPPDWPGDALRTAYGAVVMCWLEPAGDHVRARVDAHGGSGS